MKPEQIIVDIPHPIARVWDAAWTAIPLVGWELTAANRELGRLEAKVGASLYTWGENFSMNFTKTSETSTRVQVWGRVRYQYYDWGKTRKDIERFISVQQIILKER